jgi:AbrB family looped-hinge helix DNA binding protein
MAFRWYSNGMRTTIDRAGRIVIPKALRDRAGLEPGTEVEVRYRYGLVELQPRPAPTKGGLVEEGSVLVWDGGPDARPFDVLEAIEDSREERTDEIVRGDSFE